jgi:hypothetical protein
MVVSSIKRVRPRVPIQRLPPDNQSERQQYCSAKEIRRVYLPDEKHSTQQRSARLPKTVGRILDAERRTRLLISAAL